MGKFNILRWSAVFCAVMLYQNCGQFKSSVESVSNLSALNKFNCTDDSMVSETKSLMLNKLQLENAIEDLFGANVLQSVSGSLSGLADVVNDANSHERQSLVSSAEIDGYFNVAYAVAAEVVGNQATRNTIFGSCVSQAVPPNNCVDNYLDNFAPKIFRRPLTDEEKSFARNFVTQFGNNTSYLVNYESLLAYHLQSPYFLWRLELGNQVGNTVDRTYLTQYEIATRISFMATDSILDDTLLCAAQAGSLNSPGGIRSQTERLLRSPRGQDKVARMLAWWALADRAKDMSNLPAMLTNGVNTTGLNQAILDETMEFIKEVVFNDDGSFQDLLTSPKSFARHDGLATIYGHAPVTGRGPAQFSGRRQGLLMRSGFLSHDTPRTSIIHRGVDFQKRYLCNEIPLPTVDIAADRDAANLTQAELLGTSNRDATTYQTEAPVCMGCHFMINPTGFAFENFDSFGRIRDQEMIFDSMSMNGFVQNLPIDTSTSVPFGQQSVDVLDAYDLIDTVATQGAGAACMARTFYRYFNEKKETREDDCELERTYELLNSPNQKIVNALVNLIANEHIGEKVHGL